MIKVEEYIPDMTERYPEGMRDLYDEIDYEDLPTLTEAVNNYLQYDDYYNIVRVYGCDSSLILETNKLENVLKLDKHYLNALVYDYFWHDNLIVFKLLNVY